MNKYYFHNNSLFFRDVLSPTDGYEVEYAVGTTYSINMNTFLTVPIMLGAIGDVELGDTNSEASALAMMHSILQMKDKFCVFVNAGGIHLDKKCNKTGKKLFGLMDNSVYEINLNKTAKDTFNFHPKVWIILERNDSGDERIKVVVVSKNLTTDPNLDIVCELTGKVGDDDLTVDSEHQDKHKPLIDFLEYLLACGSKIKSAHRKQIRNLESCIRRVQKFDIEDYDGFDEYSFMPIGIPNHNGKKCLEQLADKGTDCFVVSPFLGEDTIAKFVASDNKNIKRTLVTRRESLLNITPAQFSRFNEVYVVKEAATDEGNEMNMGLDIHSKLYLSVQNGRHWLYLGSANATRNAFLHNVEFMVGFHIKPYSKGFDLFPKAFLEKDSQGNLLKTSLFETVTSLPSADDFQVPDDSGKQLLREAILSLKGTIVKVVKVDDSYSMLLSCKSVCQNVTIRPLMVNDLKCIISKEMRFDNIGLDSVSAFFVLEAKNEKQDEQGNNVYVDTIVKLHLEDAPGVERDDAMFRQFIDTPDKIYNYLNFIVAEDKQEVIDAMSHQEKVSNKSLATQLIAIGGLFEKLMRSSTTMPQSVINEMNKVLSEVDDCGGLKDMIGNYASALKKINRINI